MKNLYAVLVGVNDYAAPANRLSGCLNDVKRIGKYLDSLPEFSVHKTVLTDGKATKNGIVKGIRSGFANAKADDIAFFYFSGHGTQEAAPKWIDEQDHSLECLVCYDHDASSPYLLADKELRYLFGKLNPGVHLVTVFDCCHSGDNTRMIEQVKLNLSEEAAREGRKARRYGAAFRERPWTDFIFHEDIKEDDIQQKRTDTLLPLYPHIHVSACRARESAYEAKGGGIFTQYLLSVLDQHQSKLSYLDIRKYAKLYFYDRPDPQIPEVLAHGKSLHIYDGWLGLEPEPGEKMLKLLYQDDKGWMLNAGQMHGLSESNHVLLDIEGRDQPLSFHIQNVGVSTAVLQADPEKERFLDRGKFYRVRTDFRYPETFTFALVDLDCNPLLAKNIREDHKLEGIDWVDDPAKANYHVVIFNDMVFITKPFDHYRPLSLQKDVFPGDKIKGEYLRRDMEAIIHRDKVEKLENPDTFLFRKPAIKIEVAGPEDREFRETTNGEYHLRLGFQEPAELRFRLTNQTSQGVYVAALGVGCMMEVMDNTFFNEPVMYMMPNQVVEKVLPFYINGYVSVYNWPREEVKFKLLVSNREIDTSGFVQKAVTPPIWETRMRGLVPESVTREMGYPPGREDWGTQDFSVVMNNALYNDLKFAEDYLEHPIIGPFAHQNFFEVKDTGVFYPQFSKKEEALYPGEKGLLLNVGLKVGNAWGRLRRNRRFERTFSQNPDAPLFISEGDSWFQHPLLYDVIDYLMNTYTIKSLGAAGDTFRNMIKKGEIHDHIRKLQKEGQNLTGVILSGGGNDILGADLQKFLQENHDLHPPGKKPERFISPILLDEIDKIADLYEALIRQYPDLHFFGHGYDYVKPYGVEKKDGWLGKYLTEKGILEEADRKAVAAYMLKVFNDRMKALSDKLENFTFLENLGTLREDQWDDEIHPNNHGFEDIASKFNQAIQEVNLGIPLLTH